MSWRALWLALALLTLPAQALNFTTVIDTYPPGLEVFQITPDALTDTHLGRTGETLQLTARRDDELWHLYFVYARPGQDPATQGARSQELLVTPRDLEGRYPRQGGALRPNLPTEALNDYLWHKWQPVVWGVLAAGAGLAGAISWLERSRRRQAARLRKLDSLVAPSADDPLLGFRLGGYLLVSRLGQGGMASVYRAIPADTLNEADEVAVKVLDNQNADEEYRRRFQREVQVCRELFHPHIVKLIDFAEEGARRYLVMELIRGDTLRSAMKPDQGLPPNEALKLLDPIMQALEYAHDRGIVHRDLKPENIMRTTSGRVVVMDFGLARSHRFQTVTVTGNVLGTPSYMSPEQINGKWETATDQYAVGVIAYELLTGKRPFEAEDPIQIILQHLQESPAPPRQHKPGLSPELEGIVLRMLAKEPSERFTSVREAREAWLAAVRG